MDSTPNTHAAHLPQTNPTNITHGADISNPNFPAKARQTTTKSTIDAHYATVAYEREKSLRSDLSSYTPTSSPSSSSSSISNHARNTYVKRQSIDHFAQQFDMSDAYAKAAVEEEMGRRYAANPWDGDGPAWSSRRKRMRMRTEGLGEVERGEGKKRGEVKGEGEARYSEREWDDFERSLGYL